VHNKKSPEAASFYSDFSFGAFQFKLGYVGFRDHFNQDFISLISINNLLLRSVAIPDNLWK
jgi:hypothetical protein